MPQIARAGQFYWVLLTDRRPADLQYFFSVELIHVSLSWLLVASLGLLLGRRWARVCLIVWAMVVLLLELVHEIGFLQRSDWRLNASFSTLIFRVSALATRAAFPAAVIWLLSLRAVSGKSAAGFQVVSASSELAPLEGSDDDEHTAPRSVESSSRFAYDAARCIVWMVTIVGILVLVDIVPEQRYWSWPFDPGDNRPRMVVFNLAQGLAKVSYVLPMIGGALMILGYALGRWIVVVWAGLFVVLSLLGVVLHDVFYVWWMATQAKYRAQSAPELLAILGYLRMQEAALPLLAWYLLRHRTSGSEPIVKTPAPGSPA